MLISQNWKKKKEKKDRIKVVVVRFERDSPLNSKAAFQCLVAFPFIALYYLHKNNIYIYF